MVKKLPLRVCRSVYAQEFGSLTSKSNQVDIGRQTVRGATGLDLEISEEAFSVVYFANDYVDSAGQVLVEISSTDLGFESDEECGQWIAF